MITRLAGSNPTRSRAAIYENLVFTVAVAPDKVDSVLRADQAGAGVDRQEPGRGRDRQEPHPDDVRLHRRHGAEGGDGPRLGRVGRPRQSADARVPRRHARRQGPRRDRGDGGEVIPLPTEQRDGGNTATIGAVALHRDGEPSGGRLCRQQDGPPEHRPNAGGPAFAAEMKSCALPSERDGGSQPRQLRWHRETVERIRTRRWENYEGGERFGGAYPVGPPKGGTGSPIPPCSAAERRELGWLPARSPRLAANSRAPTPDDFGGLSRTEACPMGRGQGFTFVFGMLNR